MATNYLFQQSEVVHPKIAEFFGRFNVASNFIKKAPVEIIGERDFRVTYLAAEGGKFGTYNPDGGAIGRGSASTGGYMVASFFSLRLSFELTELAKKATSNRKIAQYNALKRAIKQGVPELAFYRDRIFHGDGTAVLATATAHANVGGKSVYTMDTTTGIQWLRRKQPVIVYQNDLSAARDSGASFTIDQLDYENRQAYLSGLVTSAGATDKFVFEGVSGASPASIYGLQYYHDYSTSGTTLGVNRANELEIVSNSVDAAGAPTFQKGLQLWHKCLKRRGEMPKGWIWLVSPEQQANIRAEVIDMANFDLSRGKVNADLGMKPDLRFSFAGAPAYLDIAQPTTRIDGFVPGDWIRAELPDGAPGFYTDDNGDRFFNLYGTDGSPAAATWFALTVHENFVCHNPGNAGILYNCTQPTY